MKLLCSIDGVGEGIIVGYCPDANGTPQAIVVRDNCKVESYGLGLLTIIGASKKATRSIDELMTPSDLGRPN